MTTSDSYRIEDSRRARTTAIGRLASRIWMSKRLRLAATLFFGAIVPIGCLAFAPSYAFAPLPLLAMRTLIGAEILGLLLWLRMKRPASLLAGFFSAGSIVAGFYALFLAGLAGPALFASSFARDHGTQDAILDGVRAFLCLSTPLTALAYARCAFHAHERVLGSTPPIGSTTGTLAGFMLAFAIPASACGFVTYKINTGFRDLYASMDGAEHRAIESLRPFRSYVMRREFCVMYRTEQDPTRKVKLAIAYRELKGGDIERADDSASD